MYYSYITPSITLLKKFAYEQRFDFLIFIFLVHLNLLIVVNLPYALIGIDLTPSYEIAEKQSVRDHEAPQFKRKSNLPPITKSFHEAQVNALVEDFVSSVLQVCH